MPKLLSRSKHEELESNSHCKSKIRRKEEKNVKKNGPCRSAFATATVHPASTVPPVACSPAFSRLSFFGTIFGFF